MKIITDNQIIVEGKDSKNIDDYYNAGGKEKKKGATGSKIKDFISSGKAGAVLTALSNPGGATGGTGSDYTAPLPAPTPAKKKMTTTTKVLIGVGSALVLGGILYFVLRKKKGK